ncbi:MAG TPA: hypothetical protein DDW25_00370 [Ktedonobacter sp.]|jgi:hypothetical protein|nr:hypothetical protein [Ktedonobacter sp.]
MAAQQVTGISYGCWSAYVSYNGLLRHHKMSVEWYGRLLPVHDRHSTQRTGNRTSKFLTARAAKEATLIMVFATKSRELMYCGFPTPFTQAPLRSKVNRDGLAKVIVRHERSSFVLLMTALYSSLNEFKTLDM